jgi:lysophospholipase L1-like esterase
MSQVISSKRKIIYVTLALIPVLLMFVAVEMHLRAETRQWYEKKLSRNRALKSSLMIHRKSDDPLLVYELTPGAEVSKQGIYYKINAAGFRDHEFQDPTRNAKQADEYRIVVLGDSVAWGWGVDMEKVWPQVLEADVNSQGSGKRLSVYNLAVNGYSTPQEVRILAKYGLHYQPDLVILNYVLNDPELEDGGLSWYFEAVNRIEILYKAKFLFTMIGNVIKAKLGSVAAPPNNSAMDHFYLTHHSDLFNNVKQGFADLADISKQHQIAVMVVVTPVFSFKKGEAYPWAELHQQIKTLAAEYHFEFLDTQPALSTFNSAEVSFDPIHPNVEGHKIIAAAVREKLGTKP